MYLCYLLYPVINSEVSGNIKGRLHWYALLISVTCVYSKGNVMDSIGQLGSFTI